MDVSFVTLAERPELIPEVWAMPDTWDEFMEHDHVAQALFGTVANAFRQLGVVGLDSDGQIVSHGTAIGFCLDLDGRRDLPDKGWDQALLWAYADIRNERAADTACALEVSIHTDHLGKGLSQRTFAAIRAAAKAAGFPLLVAPVRPSGKHQEPDLSMEEYAFRQRDDGLPIDPWLRVHARLGGVIERIAPVSQTISGTLEQWNEWTGVSLPNDGPAHIPGGLVPVQCIADQGIGVYVEPNVWVRHDLSDD